jgi:1,4-alpha-glucan branching enzyme
VPQAGRYVCKLSGDDERYHGSGWNRVSYVETEAIGFHGQAQSICLDVPPLAAIVLAPDI